MDISCDNPEGFSTILCCNCLLDWGVHVKGIIVYEDEGDKTIVQQEGL